MLYDFQPTVSREVFVGRQRELQQINEVLSGTSAQWIVQIVGNGGIGKTQLLHQILESATQSLNLVAPRQLIDFYVTSTQTDIGILRAIVSALGAHYFTSFADASQYLDHQLGHGTTPTLRQDAFNSVASAFLSDLRRLMADGQRVLLAFDTCEEMRSARQWLTNTLLPHLSELNYEIAESAQDKHQFAENAANIEVPLRHQLSVILAGRRHILEEIDSPHQVLTLDMSSLAKDEVVEFFQKADDLATPLSSSELDKLFELTGGRPLYVGLSYDWLRNGIGSAQELVADSRPPYADKLIDWIMRLATDEARTVKVAAIAWRRMEKSLLSWLLKIDESHATKLMTDMARFCFVKHLAPQDGLSGRFQLHDEMRDLVRQRVWGREGDFTRREILREVLAWYEKRLGDKRLLDGTRIPSYDEERTLLAEWIYYLTELDVSSGFGAWNRIFPIAIHNMDLTLCDLLNNEMRRFRDQLSTAERDEFIFQEAHLAARHENFRSARDNWRSLERRQDISDQLRARVLTRLVQAEGYTGEMEAAIRHAKTGEALHQKMLQSPLPDPELLALDEDLGKLYNNWGYVLRVTGHNHEALRRYDQALDHPSADERDAANIMNNMGFVYHQTGDPEQAKAYVTQGLAMRKKLNIPYDLGLSYNTMGMIMEQTERVDDAADLYNNAYLAFENAKSLRGQALVLINQGRLYRKINHYEPSSIALQQACDILEQLGDRANLLEALNELGCTYRQWNGAENWQKAENYLVRSLQIAEKVNNVHAQADNLEDLSILYYYQARDAFKAGNVDLQRRYMSESRAKALKAEKLASEHEIVYIKAKNQRTLGDIEFDQGQYITAFGQYFLACVNMMRAQRGSGPGLQSQVLRKRRYEQMTDHLQRRLGELPDPNVREEIIQGLVTELNNLHESEKDELESLAKCLQYSATVSGKAQKALRNHRAQGQ